MPRSIYIFALFLECSFFAACGKPSSQGNDVPPEDTIENKGASSPLQYDGYQLVWADDFNERTIDTSSWTFEIGRGGNGWGNNELQYYTRDNAAINNGFLVITARKEALNGAAYTSTRMITKDKKDFKFGRIDIRAKLPEGKGIWPALWMLGENIDSTGWPACGEIDIMELVGHEPNKVYGTMHWGPDDTQHRSKGSQNVLGTGKYSDEFHVYSIDWKQDTVKFLVDNHNYFTFTAADAGEDNYPFNSPHFFLFNVAVGGNWPGPPDATTVFPQKMIVDYVRVFQ